MPLFNVEKDLFYLGSNQLSWSNVFLLSIKVAWNLFFISCLLSLPIVSLFFLTLLIGN